MLCYQEFITFCCEVEFHDMNVPQFVHVLVDRHLSRFQYLVIMNKLLQTFACRFCLNIVLISLVLMPRIVEACGKCMFNFVQQF